MSAAIIMEDVAHGIVEGGRRKATLAPLSRRFDAGEFHVVKGPSGAGKTTLLSILSLTVRPERGMISFGDDNLTRLRAPQQAAWRRANLALVFQTSRLVSILTVKEHIRLAASIRNRPSALEEGLAILGQLGLHDKLGSLPTALSGGEKQRVAIAQSLCFGPSVLLADEPTAALDQANAALVAAVLRNYAHSSGAVVICVSHDRAVIDVADRLLELEKAQ